METYARELARTLSARPDVELLLLLNRLLGAEPEWKDLGERHVLLVDPRRRVEWVAADQVHVPRAAAAARADVLHSLASTAPALGRVVRVTTIHDLNYQLVSDSHFGLRGLGMRALVPLAARRSRRVIVDAHSTREDLAHHLGTPQAKVDVVPLGVRLPADREVAAEPEVRSQLRLGDAPVVLSLSAKRPHKNLARVVHALAALRTAGRPVLVVPGYPTPYEETLRRLAEELGVAESLRLPPWLPEMTLEGLYRIAACAVIPSLYEGFGLPVLEAMARGLPVACSNRSSLPEVAGDAALLFDPEDVSSIGSAMDRLLTDVKMVDRLRTAGRERAALFTWERTAELTVGSYRRALASA
jgi:glycosyltransferase involved in cell wall biosynthesis